ncbi:unnamed protein product, partial [marine sediment metagenome]
HHEGVLQHLERLGMDFECVSIQEVRKLMRVVPGLSPKRILFTPNFVHREEYEEALALGVLLTLDSITPLQQWPEVFEGQSLYLRVDPNEVLGRQASINTGGGESKFGITVQELMHVSGMLPQLGCKVVGLHAHAGSGILSAQHWRRIADCLVAWCAHFPDVTVLNCGGGLGVQQKPGLKGLDLQQVDAALADFKRLHPRFQLWLEPGRFVVAECGILLARVTQVKRKPQRHFIGLETGMNSLVRPAMYGAYHHIINLSRLHEPCTVRAHVVGPICDRPIA